MTTTAEKIAVMQAYMDGKPIEYRLALREKWNIATDPGWNWANTEYRIAKTSPTKIRMLAYLIGAALNWYDEQYTNVPIYWKRIPSEDKIIEVKE
jgi:hypothetical protein